MSDSNIQLSESASPGTDARWMHELRNELGTMIMASSATAHLLAAGRTEQAIENLYRIEAACQRCRSLLP